MNRLQASGTVMALAWLVLSFLALPAFIVIPVSFTDTRYLSLPQDSVSLQHWKTFLTSREWLGSIWQSLWIAVVLRTPHGQTLRYVIIPNIVPGVLSGAIFAFIHSWDELIVVIFIGGRALFTLPRRMWDGINDNLDPVIAVVATGMILFTLLVLIAELSLRARRAQSPLV
jgi:ABC-type spermidine/putrescine transport system permease subunit II